MLKKMLMATTLGLASACAVVPPETPEYTVTFENSSGGDLKSYAELVNKFNREGTKVRITGNHCLSACTYFLLADNVCVNPETRFGFHSARHWAPLLLSVPVRAEKDNKIWAKDLGSVYPGLGDWFLSEGSPLVGYEYLKGSYFIDTYGVEACE